MILVGEEDGQPPPENMLLAFLNIVENAPGAVAVHWAEHLRFAATELMTWVHICRPKCIKENRSRWFEIRKRNSKKKNVFYRMFNQNILKRKIMLLE